MFNYYLKLALRSLRRNPALTALMIVTIGLGVAASMTTYSVFRAVSGDPIPSKSSRLYTPQIDNWGPKEAGKDGEPPGAMDYRDAMALMHQGPQARRTATYPVAFSVMPENAELKPFTASGHAVFADFFPMFEVPMAFGGGWNADKDERQAPVIVISAALNEKLFGASVSGVGRSVMLDGDSYRVVGVMRDWHPQPRFYDIRNSDSFGDADEFFIPFAAAIERQVRTAGNTNCTKGPVPGWQGMLDSSECNWTSFWIELPSAADASAYRAFLDGYARDQQAAGRFDWPPNNRLRNVRDWLNSQHVVPDETRVSALIAAGFLVVCLVNVVGLMLAKFMRRSGEIGVRRALGASRRAIYQQFIVEAGIVGIAGGLLGMLLMAAGVHGVQQVFDPDIAKLARLDLSLVGMTLILAVSATILAGVYPTARAARVVPAWQLKSN